MLFRGTKKITKAYQLKNIPDNVWNKYKMKCMKDNVPTLQAGIMDFIKQYIKGNVKYRG